MKYEHKAIIDSANREGKTPAELAKELLGHDLLKAMVTSISKPAVAFSKMSEQQQESVIEELKKEMAPAIAVAIEVICSQNTHTIRMKLQKMAVGKNYQLTGLIDKTQDHIHELMDKTHDQSDVLIVLHERDYFQGLDGIKGEKDQKELAIGGDAPKDKAPRGSKAKAAGAIAKEVALTPALIDAAREFVTKQQNGTLAGLQNQLKCNHDKAAALHDVLVSEGILSETADERGNRELVRIAGQVVELATTNTNDDDVVDASFEEPEAPAVTQATITDELYVKAKTAVILERRVSSSFLKGELNVDDDTAQALLVRLEADGVVSEENEMGGRAILIDG